MTDDVAHVTYWLIQYSPDPFRHEPRNIGVFLHDGRSARCMMLGEKKKNFDPRFFCHAFNIDEETGWIYREWNHWFRTLAESSAASTQSVYDEFSRLLVSGNRFGVTEPSIITTIPEKSQDSILQELFGEFVNVPRLQESSPFQRDVENVLKVSELMFLPTFERDVEVEIGEGDNATFVHLDAILEKPEPLGIKVIQFQRVWEHTLISQINDTLHSFGTSVTQGFIAAERCIVLYDQPPPSRMAHLKRLSRHAKLLPLWENKTPKELLRIALMR